MGCSLPLLSLLYLEDKQRRDGARDLADDGLEKRMKGGIGRMKRIGVGEERLFEGAA